MQTNFSLAQLADPDLAEANSILRACVHCGFCTATCPTYVLLGDELDSPRGRIYLIKDMLENERPARAKVVTHIDRCLSCLSCMTTCPSAVHYMHLVDQARVHIEETYRRPWAESWLRRLLAFVLPRPNLFRLALVGARLAKPRARWLPGRLKGMVAMAPKTIHGPASHDRPQTFPAMGARRRRVALMTGCAQQVLAPEINAATIRLLTRHGCEVVIAEGAGCCGALTHHMGLEPDALARARANVAAWSAEIERGGLDAIVINASGCGTTVKDYGYMLRTDSAWSARAAQVSAITRDITEIMAEIGLERNPITSDLNPLPRALRGGGSDSARTDSALDAATRPDGLTVAYHSACSMQHGQGIREQPKQLLSSAGFTVRDVPEGHICCGSAGTYNLLQPAIADELRARKVRNIEGVKPDLIATGNIGCMAQIGQATGIPIVHTVELLDWATGGPEPPAMAGRRAPGAGRPR